VNPNVKLTEVGHRQYPNAKVCFNFLIFNELFVLCIEPIPCSIPSLPPHGRYVNLHSFDQKIDDGSHLDYICGHSRHHRRIFCRKGKIVPKMPRCFNGKINSNKCIIDFLINSGCRVENGPVIFSKTFYHHREKVHFTCNNNSLPLLSNETIRCINGNLSGKPICQKTSTMCTVPHTLFLRNIMNTTLPSGSSFQVGSSFSYSCIQDYQPINPSSIVECLEDGSLSHHAHCVPTSCKDHPPIISNGRTIFRSTSHGSIARYRCYPGYRLENHNLAKSTCQFGLWLPKQPPKCLPSNAKRF
jgi:hypothetical protein